MLTAFGLALLLGMPQPACSGPGCGASGYYPANGVFHASSGKIWGYFKGDIWGCGADKCACMLGSYVPGGDNWAFQMHGGMPISAPISVPVSAPSPAPVATPGASSAASPSGGAVRAPRTAPAPTTDPAMELPGESIPPLP